MVQAVLASMHLLSKTIDEDTFNALSVDEFNKKCGVNTEYLQVFNEKKQRVTLYKILNNPSSTDQESTVGSSLIMVVSWSMGVFESQLIDEPVRLFTDLNRDINDGLMRIQEEMINSADKKRKLKQKKRERRRKGKTIDEGFDRDLWSTAFS